MNRYFYIFVRQDIPLAQQIIQTSHAVIEMTKQADIPKDEIPYSVLIGIPNKVWLESVMKHLDNLGVKYEKFLDNDFDFGVAAVVTVPLEHDKSKNLKHYPLWKP